MCHEQIFLSQIFLSLHTCMCVQYNESQLDSVFFTSKDTNNSISYLLMGHLMIFFSKIIRNTKRSSQEMCYYCSLFRFNFTFPVLRTVQASIALIYCNAAALIFMCNTYMTWECTQPSLLISELDSGSSGQSLSPSCSLSCDISSCYR